MQMKIYVKEIPPYKQTPADLRERHLQTLRTKTLQEVAIREIETPLNGPVKLEITYHRGKGRSDSSNIIGGIADALNTIAYEDDRQIKILNYTEEKKSLDEYWINIERA